MVRALARLVCALSPRAAARLARLFAWLWYTAVPIRKRVSLANVARVFPDASRAQRRAIVRRSFENLCLFAVESLRLPLLTPELSASLVERRGFEHLERALARGKGVVVVTAHLGNFDLLGASQAIRGIPVHALYKPIAWRSAHEFFFGVREACGVKIIAPKGSERAILKALRAGEAVAFVIDQHMPKQRGIVTTFFGQLVSTTPAPALFALKTDATLLPATIRRAEDGIHHVVTIDPPLALERPFGESSADIRHNTERLNRWLEQKILENPGQWLWAHRRWKVQDHPEGWEIPAELRGLAAHE